MQKKLYEGKNIKVFLDGDQFAHLVLDHHSASVNKIDRDTINDLDHAIASVEGCKEAEGMIIYSAKDVFVVGADITEFKGMFQAGPKELRSWLTQTHAILNRIEDLPIPTLTAINGFCLGGGLELALTTAYRIATPQSKIGLPETKLGIYPGWGGTIRLPRVSGLDVAIEWIAGGKANNSEDAFKGGVIQALVEKDKLIEAGLAMLHDAAAGHLDWQSKVAEKTNPITLLSKNEAIMCFETSKGFIAATAGRNYPAPLRAVTSIQESFCLSRDSAIEKEMDGFIELSQTACADNLITIYLSDQFNKKQSKKLAKSGNNVKSLGVLGAGIMGGGIAYQSASKGLNVVMKDINQEALNLGLGEAAQLLEKQVQRKKITTKQVAQTMGAISATLEMNSIKNSDLVVEAVVENEKVKLSVLKELEATLKEGSVIASNTSTISISKLAKGLKNPEHFCGIHFFNPVHKMPLVEVIRGEKTSEQTVSTAVSYVLSIGKTPIVVNDCPGFLVNRVLFPYFYGFNSLLEDGVSYQHIDKVMEKFGWPMGPAYLLDVIGLDTGVHASTIMAEAFPDRMSYSGNLAMKKLTDDKRFGQKNGRGFYTYTKDNKGKLQKNHDEAAIKLIESVTKNKKEVQDEDIINRMMIPMIFECARCLDEKIVDSAMEVDLGVLYGLGFPPFRAGVLKYADDIGLSKISDLAQKLSTYGKAFDEPEYFARLRTLNRKFYH